MKNALLRNVPDKVQSTPEFAVFLKWVEDKSVSSVVQLKSVLNAEIAELQNTLDQKSAGSRLGTNTRIVRPAAKRLDFLKVCRDKIVKYL